MKRDLYSKKYGMKKNSCGEPTFVNLKLIDFVFTRRCMLRVCLPHQHKASYVRHLWLYWVTITGPVLRVLALSFSRIQ